MIDNPHDLSIWNKLHWFNFPDMPERLASQDEHLKDRILPSIEFNDYKPMYVYMYNNKIEDLYNMEHSFKTIEHLNKEGVTFYLNEPLCMYDVDEHIENKLRHTMNFYSELAGKTDPNNLRAEELNSIRHYVIKNNLTNVTVKTCDYLCNWFLPYYKKWMILECEDTFIKNAVYVNVFDDSFTNDLVGRASNDFSKKFMNLNWRWTPHRNLIAAYLVNSSSLVSFFYKTKLEKLHNLPWFDLSECPTEYKDRIQHGLSSIYKKGPFCVDIQSKEFEDPDSEFHPANNTIDDYYDPATDIMPIEKYYKDIFCDVVTESRFAQPTANYSEKVHQPMFYKKPFILMAPPGTLKYLHEQGYQTFSEYWDESYDLCEDHEERLYKIFDVIKYIESKSINELKNIYEDMKPILLHNYNQVKSNIYEWW
jgi:hypothetical protein